MENNKDNFKKYSSMFTYEYKHVSLPTAIVAISLCIIIPIFIINYLVIKDNGQNNDIIFSAIIATVAQVLPMLLIVGIVTFIINRNIKAGKKENMSKIDFQKEKGLYRDILGKYTPAVLSYIDDYTIEPETDIPAIILMLEMKGKIEITNNKINVINLNSDDLGKSERYILKNINNGKVKIEDLSEFKLIIREEAKTSGLIKEDEEAFEETIENIQNLFNFNNNGVKATLKNIGKVVFFCGILVVLMFIINFLMEQGIVSGNVGVYFMFFAFIISSIIVLRPMGSFPSTMSMTKMAVGKRTNEGEVTNEKVEGLKNYIMNYTLLSEREKKELVIWEEYLIYSVLFGINIKVVEELSKLIEVKY